MKSLPTFKEENLLWEQGHTFIAGIDEVGRGAFAGPLVTAAVIFPPNCVFSDPDLLTINDSKVLSPKRRQVLSEKIKIAANSYSITEVPLSYINRYGIGKAAQLGFYQSVKTLTTAPDFCLIDAFFIKKLKKSVQKPIIKGDSLSISIAAASIIAKVHRDELMEKLHPKVPMYNFAQNKGYGTKFHREQLKIHGLSPFHRLSFNLSVFID
jgi:ribonuclease HII